MLSHTPLHVAVFFLSVFFVIDLITSASNAKLAKCELFDEQGRKFLERKENEGMDVWKKFRQGKQFIVMIMENDFPDFLAEASQSNVACETINQDLMASVMEEDDSNKKLKANKKKHDIVGTYPTYQEIYDWMVHEHKLQPTITQVISMGCTELGRRQLVMRISKGLGKTGSWLTEMFRRKKQKPVIWIHGGSRAREWLSVTSAIYIIDKLLHDKDPYIGSLLDCFEFHICPVLNPDGYDFTHNLDNTEDFPQQVQGLDLLLRRLWLKDMSNTSQTDRCVGTDLERNFGHHWNVSTRTFCLNPCSDCFVGDAAFSSKSSENLARYLLDLKNIHNEEIRAFVSFHTYGQLAVVPWGFTQEKPEDNDRLRLIASRMASIMGAVRGAKFLTLSIPEITDPNSGLSIDWAKGGVVDVANSYHIELFPDLSNSMGFIQTVDKIIPTGKEAWLAIFTLANAMFG